MRLWPPLQTSRYEEVAPEQPEQSNADFSDEFVKYCAFSYLGGYQGIIHFTVSQQEGPPVVFALNCDPDQGINIEHNADVSNSTVAVGLSQDVFSQVLPSLPHCICCCLRHSP